MIAVATTTELLLDKRRRADLAHVAATAAAEPDYRLNLTGRWFST